MARGNQLTRQWRLLHLLDRPAGVTVEDAAADLGCAVRTIWRDLRVLQDAGFPIYDEAMGDGRRSVWRFQEAFRLRLPLHLSVTELVALVMSRGLLSPAGAAALGPAVAQAFDKVAGVLTRQARDLLARMQEVIGVRGVGAKLQGPAEEHLRQIQAALLERRRLRLRYYSMSRDEVTQRQVDPYHLTLFHGGFYLVGYCHLREAVRIFAVERIRELAVLRERFERPGDFDPERYLAGAWGIIRGDIVTVRVRFGRGVARCVRERLWHPTQRLRGVEGGGVELTLQVADTLEVRRWILGFGPEAEVVAPPALREALRRDVQGAGRRGGASPHTAN